MFRNALAALGAAFRAACLPAPRKTQVERTIDLLNDITHFAFPDHVWHAYGRTDTPDETNYRLISRAEYRQNGLNSAQGEIPINVFRLMQSVFRQSGIVPNYHEGEMTLTSRSVHDLTRARPCIEGLTLDWLKVVAPALKANLTATAQQHWRFTGIYPKV